MFSRIASMSRGGTRLESMWCHCKIWCSTIPSTNPPIPIPKQTPAALSFACTPKA
ncbi:hypothetical protein Mterra_04060 [Calidithermus terrae]|uniref:Uncharacterized protein n=1 Tax=Calidithermus terrae TaxID=1408545 RepID=A0A399DWG7_9DEIN|nr:hypothetical protein Mterra_04060 [Calidithermus terrae]